MMLQAAALVLSTIAGGTTVPQPIDRVQWFGPDDYPSEALRARAQGMVVFVVAVDAEGNPSGCSIAESSGSAALDQATCTLALKRSHFVPAHDAADIAVPGSYTGRVRWTMPGAETGMIDALVEFGGSAADPQCTLTRDGRPRRLIREMCRSLVTAIIARAGDWTKPTTISIPSDDRYLQQQ